MEVLMEERANLVFHNKVIDGTAMKRLISRFIDHFGMAYTSHILDQVKTLGFQQATVTSISLGIDDLLTIPSKKLLVQDAEQQSFIYSMTRIKRGYIARRRRTKIRLFASSFLCAVS